MKLLVSNVGSTSLKFKFFDMPEERVLCEAKIERVGSRDAAIMSYRSHLSGARFSAEGLCIPSYAEGIALFLEKLTGDETGVIKGVEEISAIGFKTVLSRGYYGVHELTDEVMENMREYLYIAPVHNAAYIEAVGQFKAVLPDVPMIGVFETAFHREIPLERALYSIPYEWYEKYGIRKMGYHGASHGYIAQQAAKLGRAERVISCHLGGSCSICAILGGKSVDNSFGFSLQTGVMHANRAGDIDPYIVPFLMSKGMELDDILHGLSKNGGLLGVSGVSNDLREVSAAAADGNARAELAINMFVCSMAVAASSNLILHIPAIANEAGYDLPWWKYFDEASNEIPLLSHLAPSGPYNVKDFDLAGGMRAMLKELLPKLHGDCLTVTGHTLEENVRDAVVYNRDVIHSLDNPVMTEPGIGVLYGNLAPEGAIVKIAGVPSQLMTYKGKARVFDSLEDGIQALRAGQIHVGDCCVLRFMGLRGRFGTTAFTFQEELKGLHELYNSCAIITDGRFSGGTSGLSIGYVSPEAALGSPLGVIEEGDEVEIDIPARKLHLCISDEEMNRRLAAFHWEFPSKDYPRYLNLFVQNVGSMAKGGIWETK